MTKARHITFAIMAQRFAVAVDLMRQRAAVAHQSADGNCYADDPTAI